MTLILSDRILETSSTTGTGSFTLAGAVTGFRAFSSVCSVSDTFYYLIELVDANGNPSGDWEEGLGTYSGANTLARTTVLASSNANAAVNFASGTKRCSIVINNGWIVRSIAGNGHTMSTSRLLGRTTAATGAIEELTLTQALDLIGSAAQGDILYRDGSAWARLGAGTSGQFLKTLGASANPAWAAPAITAIDSATVATAESRGSTSYGDLTTSGPSVTLTTGTSVIITINARMIPTGNCNALIGIDISGATTVAASDTTALEGTVFAGAYVAYSRTLKITSLTAGSNTFKLKYKTNTGTSCEFAKRDITVVAL